MIGVLRGLAYRSPMLESVLRFVFTVLNRFPALERVAIVAGLVTEWGPVDMARPVAKGGLRRKLPPRPEFATPFEVLVAAHKHRH
jgi:hypothetical protein